MAEDDEAVLSEVRKLPLAERVSHKNWKARGEAYDSIASACERAVGDSDVAEFGAIREAETALMVAFRKYLISILSIYVWHRLLRGGFPGSQALIWQKRHWKAMRPLWTGR